MYQGGVYGAGPPMYGMYGFDPRMAEAGQGRGRYERETAPVKFTEGKLFIGGVEANIISKEDLVEYCSQWGEVADAVVMDRKGYGFVTFADPKAAMKFLEKRLHELKGRRLDAKAAVPKAHLGTAKLTKKMFVGGTGDLTDQDFRDHFSQFGDIEDAAVVRREGQSRGFGFVTFADEISVEKCLLVSHYIKGRKVELKRAVPKDEVMAAQGMGVFGYPPGPYSQQPGMMQQQFYPMPYGPGPAAYGMRPGFPPSPAGMPMAGDPYGWYGMGYMYYPPAGMYPTPYGMMPQPGVPPYGVMPYPAMPGPAGMQGGPRLHQGAGPSGAGASSSAGGSGGPSGGGVGQSLGRGEAGSSSGGGAGSRGAGSSSEAAAGSSQQQEALAASPAGPTSSPEPGLTGPQRPPGALGPTAGVRRVGSDPAASSSHLQPPGIMQASGSGPASSPAAARQARSPIVTSFPSAGMRLAGVPGPQRAMGPGLMPFAAAGVAPPGAVLPAGLPGAVLPGRPRGGPMMSPQQQQQQQQGGRPSQQQRPAQQ